jgi:putative SOS response-associated peptidase YedK
VRLSEPYRPSATPTARAAVSCRWMAFFEWKAIKGQKAKQPYAIAMKDGRRSVLPAFGRTGKTWLQVTGFGLSRSLPPNELVAEIHDRMPVIIAPSDYVRWLSDEPDPSDLMRPFPVGLMRMWPISTRVNKPENDDPSIVEPIELTTDVA